MVAQRALILAVLFLLALPAQAANYLWEVRSLTNSVYLYGTVHAGKKEWYPLDPAVEEAFRESKVLVVEADVSDPAVLARSAALMMYAPPDVLKNHVEAANYARFVKMLARYQLPEEAVGHMKPLMAVSMLVFSEWSRLGYLPQYGVDAYFTARAKAGQMTVLEIEGTEIQAQLMDSLTDKENRLIFDGTLTALESGLTGEQITGMVNAWQSGDPKLMLEIARKYNEDVAGAKEFEDKFIWDRHGPMMAKIEGYLNDSRERHFIAVGALHLAGPRGLVELLAKKGYMVKQK